MSEEGMTPVELRAMARDMGIEGWDRMTGRQALEAIRRHPEGESMTHSYYEVFQGKDGMWYWRHVSDNGEELSRSSEGDGYDSKYNAARALRREVDLAKEHDGEFMWAEGVESE